MKTAIKTIAYATMASFTLLACADTASIDADNAAKPQFSCRTYIAYDEVYSGPAYDPALVIIVGDVKDWMDEQFASGGKERKYISISISDLPLIRNPIEEPEVSGTYDSITGKTTFIVNGQEMTMDEHKIFVNAWAEEAMRLRAEIISSYMASVHVPGEEVEMRHAGWEALMTAEDIAELAENNEGLTIYFWQEAPYMPVIPTIDIPYERLDPICKSELRELVYISDLHLKKDGKGKRDDLPIPCVIYDDDRTWTALLTDEEISELPEKYGELVISDFAFTVPLGTAQDNGGNGRIEAMCGD